MAAGAGACRRDAALRRRGGGVLDRALVPTVTELIEALQAGLVELTRRLEGALAELDELRTILRRAGLDTGYPDEIDGGDGGDGDDEK